MGQATVDGGSRATGTVGPPPADPDRQGKRPRARLSLSVRWGTWVARHRWWVLGAWIVLLVGAVLVYPHLSLSGQI